MVEIGDKPRIKRTAIAEGKVFLSKESIHHIKNNSNPKGDVLENAKLAAIHAVKKTPDLVFMCHPIRITGVKVNFSIKEEFILARVKVTAIDKTGAEIEAMAGVMNALLAIFDVSKRYEKDMDGQYNTARISDVQVVHKVKE